MTVSKANKMNVSEFLKWYETQPERPRYELINGTPVAMSPERVRHAAVKLAVAVALKQATKGIKQRCHVLPDGMSVVVDDYTTYEPDALVYCGDELAGDAVVVSEPVIIVEVLSPSTKHVDSGSKLVGYFAVESVQHYLVIDPISEKIIHHSRGDDGHIVTAIIANGELQLTPPGLLIQYADIF